MPIPLTARSLRSGEPELQPARQDPHPGRCQQRYDEPDARTCHLLSNFQLPGGEHVMQGWDAIPEAKSIEFGLDVTELLNMVPAGKPARYFLAVEERDPDHQREWHYSKSLLYQLPGWGL